MITQDQFDAAVTQILGFPLDDEKLGAVREDLTTPLFIVAGPGTGKTTTLVFRILKLVFVDSIAPPSILATTFTKKAAAELRSRILDWGFQLIEIVNADTSIDEDIRQAVFDVDINQVITGTLDSICELTLRDYRIPGEMPKNLVDDFAAKTLLTRAYFQTRSHENTDLLQFLTDLNGRNIGRGQVADAVGLLGQIWDRRHQDIVDWDGYVADETIPEENQRVRQSINNVFEHYQTELDNYAMTDFAQLERVFLDRLTDHRLNEWCAPIQVVLVDEYQDTNALQEAIYFKICEIGGATLTVVGDDDQSLYQFRGASVDLFVEYEHRFRAQFGSDCEKKYLTTNYRSTAQIINFVNDYAELDASYQGARVAEKPRLAYQTDKDTGESLQEGPLVLAMYRDSVNELAESLCDFLSQIFEGAGYVLEDGVRITKKAEKGQWGDTCLLMGSPREVNKGGRERLPLRIRELFQAANPVVQVYNPRGRNFNTLLHVQEFGGLILSCIDPITIRLEDEIYIPRGTSPVLTAWRTAANDFVNDSPPQELIDLIDKWQSRYDNPTTWPRNASLLQLIYDLLPFFPYFYDDSEGQAIFEVFTRQANVCAQVSNYSGDIVTNSANRRSSEGSVRAVFKDFFIPIATGIIDIDEELMGDLPTDKFNIISIHQSKGLEFPLCIVDVGSDFGRNHSGQRMFRYPDSASTSHKIEEHFRSYTNLEVNPRNNTTRAYDELIRKYFVAFSRAKDVLLLIGLSSSRPSGRIPNVALGWTIGEPNVSQWQDEPPYIEI
jgi:DNA helicase II / ATP-dependent DNA helicase PcrA